MIQRKINARPREKLNFLTPDEVVYKKLRKFALAN
jgi:IS30 family transposase